MKVDNPCPWCGIRALHIGEELQAKPVGSYSLSGAQIKVSAQVVPILECGNCDLSVDGGYDAANHAVFNIPDKMK